MEGGHPREPRGGALGDVAREGLGGAVELPMGRRVGLEVPVLERLPARLGDQPAHHGEVGVEDVVDVAADEALVDGQAPGVDAGLGGRPLDVAAPEGPVQGRLHLAQGRHVATFPRTDSPTARMRSFSSASSAMGGMSLSRSSSVDTGPVSPRVKA